MSLFLFLLIFIFVYIYIFIKFTKKWYQFARTYGIREPIHDEYIKLYKEYYNNQDRPDDLNISNLMKTKIKKLSEPEKKILLKNKNLTEEIKNEKPIPYDMATDVIKSFCDAVKICKKKCENGNQKHFTMKHKSIYTFSSLYIPIDSITKNGIYPSEFKNCKEKKEPSRFIKRLIKKKLIHSDCRLKYYPNTQKYFLCVPTYVQIVQKFAEGNVKREEYCALDPGEKIFQTYYGEETCGTIGDMIRTKILAIQNRIHKLRKVLRKNRNKNGKRIKHKKTLKQKIRNLYQKMSNVVSELHNKTCIFLCKNFERILIPDFRTQNMLSDHVSLYKNKLKKANAENKKNQILKEQESQKTGKCYVKEEFIPLKNFYRAKNEKSRLKEKQKETEKYKANRNRFEVLKQFELSNNDIPFDAQNVQIVQNVQNVQDVQEVQNVSNIQSINKNPNKKRLKGNVKIVLQNLSHYKFRKTLLDKGVEYGCKVDVVTEEYTSKTCGNCGEISDYYVNREKRCTHCKTKIDRDINGSRNIFIKNIEKIVSTIKIQNLPLEERLDKLENPLEIKKIESTENIGTIKIPLENQEPLVLSKSVDLRESSVLSKSVDLRKQVKNSKKVSLKKCIPRPGSAWVPITQSFDVSADSLIEIFALKSDVHQKISVSEMTSEG